MAWARALLASLLACFCCAQVAFVHIGPHKTGTTHIQSLLTNSNATKLQAEGFCYPFLQDDPKVLSEFLDGILANRSGSVEALKAALRGCLNQRSHIVISSETLSYLPAYNKTGILREILPNRTIHIVGAYREWLQRSYSSYTQTAKLTYDTVPFSTYLFSPRVLLRSSVMARDKISEFADSTADFDQLTIVDYDAVRAAGGDIAHAVLCRVMGLACATTSSLSASFSNIAPPMLVYNLFAIARDFVDGLGCSLCHTKPHTFFAFVNHHNDHPPTATFPTMDSDLAELKSFAKERDASFRSRFAKQMVLSDPAASRRAIDEFRVSIIDSRRFFSDCSECTLWLRDEVRRWRREGLLCGCVGLVLDGSTV